MKINEWAEVTPLHCHKRLEENKLVEKVRFVSEDKKYTESLHRFVPEELPFFYDHPIHHLPGMLLMCAARQACLAIGHIVYDVPMNFETIIHSLNVDFYNYVADDKPVVSFTESNIVNRRKNKVTIDMCLTMRQSGLDMMKLTGRMICVSKDMGKILRDPEFKDVMVHKVAQV